MPGSDSSLSLSCAVSTWNVAAMPGAAASASGADAWVRAGRSEPADVHVVCLQEAVDIDSPVSYLSNPLVGWNASEAPDGLLEPLSTDVAAFETALRAMLPSHVLIAKKQLVGIVLFIFVKQQHAAACTAARVAHIGAGPFGAGNKGAVAASFRLYGTTVCFVCSHLPAGAKGVHTRLVTGRLVTARATLTRTHAAVICALSS